MKWEYGDETEEAEQEERNHVSLELDGRLRARKADGFAHSNSAKGPWKVCLKLEAEGSRRSVGYLVEDVGDPETEETTDVCRDLIVVLPSDGGAEMQMRFSHDDAIILRRIAPRR